MEDIKDTGHVTFEKPVEAGLYEDVELRVGEGRPKSCLRRFRWAVAAIIIFLGTFLWHGLGEHTTTVQSSGSSDQRLSFWPSLLGEKSHRGRRFLNGKAAERIFLYVTNHSMKSDKCHAPPQDRPEQ